MKFLNAIHVIAKYVVFIAAISLFLLQTAWSNPAASFNGKQLGAARLTVFGFNIYDAKLWATDSFNAARYDKENFALELLYLRSFKGTDIAQRSLKEMRRQANVPDAQAEAWLEQMRKTFPDVAKGDVIIGTHKSDGSASFSHNGKLIGESKDVAFNRLFFGIWLSARTSEPHMRLQLIGETHK